MVARNDKPVAPNRPCNDNSMLTKLKQILSKFERQLEHLVQAADAFLCSLARSKKSVQHLEQLVWSLIFKKMSKERHPNLLERIH